MGRVMVSPYDRAMRRSVVQDLGHDTPCRLSTLLRLQNGYAQVRLTGGPMVYTHRLVWQHHYGEIPSGMTIDHLCHPGDGSCHGGPTCPHRGCLEIEHLALATPGENTLRGLSPWAVNARKTHCIRGHEFTPENTTTNRGWRYCLACAKLRACMA